MNDGPRLPASSPGAVVRAPPRASGENAARFLWTSAWRFVMGCLSPSLSSSCGSPSTSSSLVFFLELATKYTHERYPRKQQHPLENYARLAYDIAVALEDHADVV